jgi:VWFA-related protein
MMLGLGLLLFALSSAPPEPPPLPDTQFGEEITVELTTLVVRAVDDSGQPIRGLGPRDFRVKVGGREVPVANVDWISERPEPRPAAPPVPEWPLPAEASAAPRRLGVVFVQADINAHEVRTWGHFTSLPYIRDLLARLPEGDELAVVSFDSHLKLRQDFTRDRAAVEKAIVQAIHFGSAASPAAPSGSVSLAKTFDAAEALRVANPERALLRTAEALVPLPGEKVIFYLGWGLGRFGTPMNLLPDYIPAVKALLAARASVFVLDVSRSSYHSLEVGLQGVAEETGGTYGRMSGFPAQVIRNLTGTLSGYYLLTLRGEDLPAPGKVDVALRGRKGTLLVRVSP